MVVRSPLLQRLGNEGHYFNAGEPAKRLVPAGPDHAQVAAARGIAEYFDALDAHHARSCRRPGCARACRARAQLLRAAELPLLTTLLG